MRSKLAAILAAIGIAGALAACETATPYQPLTQNSTASGGFSDQKIEPDRFRVSFQGNTLTSRKTVESYLLYRSAELTLAQGYDWFEAVDRSTDRSTQTYYDDPYWHPYWRFGGFHHHFGWGAWGPWPDDFDTETVESFAASTEIVMHHGPKPAADPRAYDAHAVIANLGPTIQRPKA
jgi:hypothetical protein